VYLPSYVLLTWSYKAAEWAWEVEELAELAAGFDVASESTSEPLIGSASQIPSAFDAFMFNPKVVEAVIAADDVLHSGVGDAFNSAVLLVSVEREDVSDPSGPKLSTGTRSLAPVPHLPVLTPRPLDLREIEQPAYTVRDNVRAVDRQAASGWGRWVLKGYKTLYAHLFRPDALRQAVVDAPHEVNECDDPEKVRSRKRSTDLLS
jgi:hypothetical protein